MIYLYLSLLIFSSFPISLFIYFLLNISIFGSIYWIQCSKQWNVILHLFIQSKQKYLFTWNSKALLQFSKICNNATSHFMQNVLMPSLQRSSEIFVEIWVHFFATQVIYSVLIFSLLTAVFWNIFQRVMDIFLSSYLCLMIWNILYSFIKQHLKWSETEPKCLENILLARGKIKCRVRKLFAPNHVKSTSQL